MLALVLEAIQKAIFIIYSSPEIATEVCYKISDEIDSYRMPDENIQKEKTEIIISLIINRSFISDDYRYLIF